MSTRPVDVAAVLGEAIWTAEGGNVPRPAEIQQMHDARAAFLNLAEAHKELLARAKRELVDPEDVPEIEYAETALARCGVAP